MFARLIDWFCGLVFMAASKRIAQQVGEWQGEEVEPLTLEDVAPRQLPAPRRR